MTPIQYKVYEFIQQHIKHHGYSPSLVEIARGIGISPNSISLMSRTVHALIAAGKLKFNKKGYRNIEVVVDSGWSLPLLGRIAAGSPIEAIEDKQMIDLGSLFTGADYFLLEVQGDSMVDEGIYDGDLVICKHVKQAQEGDIVIALIDAQEVTLKQFSQANEQITLIPANPNLKPKSYASQRVQIQGLFVGLLRLKKK